MTSSEGDAKACTFYHSLRFILTLVTAEERAANNQRENKRRKVEASTGSGPSAALRLAEVPSAPSLPSHPSLPPKPDFAQKADALGLGVKPAAQETKNDDAAVTSALAGSNRDVVANRAAIRMANMNAAEMLKAEMAGLMPVKPSKHAASSKKLSELAATPSAHAVAATSTPVDVPSKISIDTIPREDDFPGFGAPQVVPDDTSLLDSSVVMSVDPGNVSLGDTTMVVDGVEGKAKRYEAHFLQDN